MSKNETMEFIEGFTFTKEEIDRCYAELTGSEYRDEFSENIKSLEKKDKKIQQVII